MEVREALAARLADAHDDARCEALVGLARRRDPRALEHLLVRADVSTVWKMELQAAALSADPLLAEWVAELEQDWGHGGDARTWRLARDRCAPGAAGRAGLREQAMLARARADGASVRLEGSYPRTRSVVTFTDGREHDWALWPDASEVDWDDYRAPGGGRGSGV